MQNLPEITGFDFEQTIETLCMYIHVKVFLFVFYVYLLKLYFTNDALEMDLYHY